RWWDGSAWTAHLAAPPTAGPTQSYGGTAPAPNAYSADGFGYGAITIESATPSHWNTVSVWLLVFSYLIVGIVTAFAIPIGFASNGGVQGALLLLVVTLVVMLVFVILLAALDQRALRKYGFERTASPWWMLLYPIVGSFAYLIARTVRVRREAGRGGAPLWTALTLFAVYLVLVGLALPAVNAQRDVAARRLFESQVTQGLDSRGGNYSLTCTPQQFSLDIGSHFSCTAVDANTQVPHTLSIEVVAGVDGKPTAKLDSVVPPLTQ
ncbi:MAG TPA: DUF2510 domain-containing protein, partial [Galbitalea sp.]